VWLSENKLYSHQGSSRSVRAFFFGVPSVVNISTTEITDLTSDV
jgi:hypothetical protein